MLGTDSYLHRSDVTFGGVFLWFCRPSFCLVNQGSSHNKILKVGIKATDTFKGSGVLLSKKILTSFLRSVLQMLRQNKSHTLFYISKKSVILNNRQQNEVQKLFEKISYSGFDKMFIDLK